MRAIQISEYGDADVLQPVDIAVPTLAAGEVLIRVRAAGVNRPDILQRRGLYPPPPGVSPIPGLEIAGEVVACGEGRWREGDRVCALTAGGGYAEFVAVPEPLCLPIPEGLDWTQAAALPETFFTVWSNVVERAGLAAGDTLLVHGGGSGIGTAAIQLGRHLGARVLTTAGSDDKCRRCVELGAERAINYHTDDFVKAVKAATDGGGADVILDMIGGDYIQRNIRAAAIEGRLVSIAFLQGATAEVDFMPVMQKRLTLTGSTLRARSIAFKGAIARALETRVWPALADGAIGAVIDSVVPLEQAAEAHRRMESREHFGKIVLTLGGGRE